MRELYISHNCYHHETAINSIWRVISVGLLCVMSNTDTRWIAFLQHDILCNPLVSRKRTLADFRKTKTPFRSGCNYARRRLLPAVWEEVRQGEKSNDFPSVSYQRAVSSKPFTRLNSGWKACAATHLIVPKLHLVCTTDSTRKVVSCCNAKMTWNATLY